MSGFPLLSVLIFLPLVLIIPIILIHEEKRKVLWGYGLIATGIEFLLSLLLLLNFDTTVTGFQWVENARWIPSIGASYHLGVDGMSLLLIILTTFLVFIGILSSTNYIKSRIKEYLILFLALEASMIGVFLSLDLLLFFLFWEFQLIPMGFLIGIYGHERRVYATFKFILYTMAGSIFLLTSLLVLYFRHHSLFGVYTFDLLALSGTQLPLSLEKLLFLGFAIAFAIKIPLFPFHTWLPDAHVEAPTAGSVILAGILLKMGIYGFIRFSFPLFPAATNSFQSLFIVLGIIGIIYGALMAWVQEDLKRLVAYSSVAHLGFITLGVFSLNTVGIQGGIIQMINHGISTGGLFLIVGLLYERRHTRLINQLANVGKSAPVLATIFGIIMLSSIGLPGLNGFIGEILCLYGGYTINKTYAFWGVLGIVLAAVYLLNAYGRVVFRPSPDRIKDVNVREFLVFLPLLLLIFWIGIYPKPFFEITRSVAAKIAVIRAVPTQDTTNINTEVPFKGGEMKEGENR